MIIERIFKYKNPGVCIKNFNDIHSLFYDDLKHNPPLINCNDSSKISIFDVLQVKTITTF